MHYIKKKFAQTLRKEQTPGEKIVWEIVRNRQVYGYKFRRQHVINGFIVDFYCHELRLAIEIDGSIHDNQRDYDIQRQKIIEEENIRIARFSNRDIFRDSSIIKSSIAEFISTNNI